MSPIKGLSENKRLPRLGKIHLGVKVKNLKGVEYPRATDYFVCPLEVQEVYSEKPKVLDVIIPVEDDEMWANQYYRQYSRTRGLVCKGDGEICRRMVDKATGNVANRNSKEVVWQETACKGRDCPDYQSKACSEVMNLQFMLPKVPGLGIWQIDTGSINSIRQINDAATMIRAICGRINWIPLTLTIEPATVVNPDDGKKKTIHCLNIRHSASLVDLLNKSEKPKVELLIAAPSEEEAPLDEIPPEDHPPQNDILQAEEDIEEIWPEDEVTVEQITSLHELEMYAHNRWHIQPTKMYQELGYSSKADVSEKPFDCFLRLKAVFEV